MQDKSMKGQECKHKPILCQEGWCNECQVHIDWIGHQRTMGRESAIVGKWKGDNEVCLRCGVSRTALKEMLSTKDRSNLTIANHILEGCPACSKALGG